YRLAAATVDEPAFDDGTAEPRPYGELRASARAAGARRRSQEKNAGGAGDAGEEGSQHVLSINFATTTDADLAFSKQGEIGTTAGGAADEGRDDKLPPGSSHLIFHPMEPFKIKWDLFVGSLILLSCISVPFTISFDVRESVGLTAVESCVDLLFFVDIIFSFRTAFEDDDGIIIGNAHAIGSRYLRSWFPIDFVTTVPFDKLFALVVASNSGVLRSAKLLRVMRLLRLARLLKLASKVKPSEDDVDNSWNPSAVALFKMFGGICFIAHLLGCGWHWMAALRGDELNWMSLYGVQDQSMGFQYITSLYWAFTTMTTVGYGDIVPTNSLERGFAIVGMLTGASVFGYIIGNITVIMASFDIQDALRAEKLGHVNEWIQDQNLPHALARRVRRQCKYALKHSGVFDNSDILGAMPGVTAISMVFAQYSQLINKAAFLKEHPAPLVAQLMSSFRPAFALPGDVVYFERDVGTHWYILWGGGEIHFYVTITA
ncbi:unnamed protein product, partial [Phaeothamnion confervicola]